MNAFWAGFADEAAKLAAPLYTYVPELAVESVLGKGLLSGKALLENPEALALAAASRGMTPQAFEREIRANLSSWKSYSSRGPNAVFHPLAVPDDRLSKKHPTKTRPMSLIRIDLEALLRDEPKTKLYGMELKPYAEGASKPGERHHYIGEKKRSRLAAQSPEEYWSTYRDIEDRGMYAPDVPHVAIHTRSGRVDGKYLSKLAARMKHTPVVSSNLKSVGYDEGSKKLQVRFHGSGTYEYANVPATVPQALLGSKSPGKTFNELVRGAGFDFRRMGRRPKRQPKAAPKRAPKKLLKAAGHAGPGENFLLQDGSRLPNQGKPPPAPRPLRPRRRPILVPEPTQGKLAGVRIPKISDSAGLRPKDIHRLADAKGVKWNNAPSFLEMSRRLTGKEHLDDMNDAELGRIAGELERMR